MNELAAPVKEYNEVLLLAGSITRSTIRETADGFQVKDLIPILSNNLDEAKTAFEGSTLIAEAFSKKHLKQTVSVTVAFVIDTACDIIKIGEPASGMPFKEARELITAVSGITSSVISRLPGGFKAAEIFPVVTENFDNIIVGVEGANKISEEFKTDVRAFLQMVVQAAVNIAFDVINALEAKVTPS